MLNKVLAISFLCGLLVGHRTFSQTEKFAISKEKIVSIQNLGTKKSVSLAGYSNEFIYFYYADSLGRVTLLTLDESNLSIKKDLRFFNSKNKVVETTKSQGITFFKGYFDVDRKYALSLIDSLPISDFEYQDFWIDYEGTQFNVDRWPVYYLDKYIRCSFSKPEKCLICNPYTDNSPYYDKEIDEKIVIYNLTSPKKSVLSRESIKCSRCKNTFNIKDRYVFNQELPIGKGFDGFYNNVYSSPKLDIGDTAKIAHDIDVTLVSPDGRYILGGKFLCEKYTKLVIDVNTKRFQYLLGRDYVDAQPFYSEKEKKFGFFFQNTIVYVDMPGSFPFNALENTTFKEDEDCKALSKFVHRPLK